jgi:hypothetical protein
MTSTEVLYAASLGDGSPTVVAELPLRLPPDKVGILVGRPDTVRPAHPERKLARRSDAVVVGASRLEWVEILASDLTRVAVNMGRSSHAVTSVVICPTGVSPARTALAYVVGELLRPSRNRPAVMCAQCPPLGAGRIAVPHEVLVTLKGWDRPQLRHVWEIVSLLDIPAWLDALAPRQIAA